MKKILTLIALISFSASAFAQLGPRSIVKTDLTSYIPVKFNVMSSANVNYEFKLNSKFSVGLVSGALISRTLELGASGTQGNGNTMTYKGEIKPSGFFLNPYARMYTKEAMKGFYVEVFTRYYKYNFDIPYDYEKNGSIIEAAAVAEAKAFGGGIVLGTQLTFGKRYALDFYAGAGMGMGNAHAETNDPQLDAADFAKIKQEMDELEDVEVALVGTAINNMTYDANSTSAWADVNNYAIPMLRAGIAFGIMF